MKTEEIALSRVSENEANPREISQANFQKLVQSIIVFPRMLTLRPIVVDETFHALGGNMRLKALQHIVTMDEALNICKRKGYVRWSDIKLDAENLLRARLEKAMNLGTREKYSKYYTMSAADYMKWCWNNPQAAHSPYKMFEGAMVPADERDSEGNIVYKYNGAKF
jgi:hypothetical protein